MRSALNSAEHFSRVEEATRSALNDCPVLTIFGQPDPWGFQDRLAGIFPDHEGMVVPKSHHFPMTDDPDLFVDTVRDWWQRRVARQTI
jgi:pimeloyl-ACP methyl ester carboxylesterase